MIAKDLMALSTIIFWGSWAILVNQSGNIKLSLLPLFLLLV